MLIIGYVTIIIYLNFPCKLFAVAVCDQVIFDMPGYTMNSTITQLFEIFLAQLSNTLNFLSNSVTWGENFLRG